MRINPFRAKGDIAEQQACEHLSALGFAIIDRNFHSRHGEIDVIASKEGVYHFIEIKSGEGFAPVYNITPKKLQKVIKTAEYYIHKKRVTSPFCISAVIIADGEIEFLENITL